MFAGSKRGAIVGMEWHKPVTGDLALAGAERYPQFQHQRQSGELTAATFRPECVAICIAMPAARPSRRKLIMLSIFAIFLVPLIARAALYAAGNDPRSWRDADWSSTGLLPKASDYKPARVIVFTGKAGAWKGMFAVHSWIVLKPANAQNGRATTWSAGATRCAPTAGRRTGAGTATRRWRSPIFPGREAEKLIPKIEAAVDDYRFSHAGDYRIWPGPNSNSFTAAILRAVPELSVALPPNAVGRDFRDRFYAGLTDSGTGVELNLLGFAAREARLGRGRRGRSARAGGRARSAPSRRQAAGLRPHRRRIAGRHRAARNMNHSQFVSRQFVPM